MGTKTISITDAAYARLAQEKREGESFTDVILRLTGRRSLRVLQNLVTKEEADARRAGEE
jgi:predicted CopG family antitoxin